MQIHNRKSPRVAWHNYNGGMYFVTFCTHERLHYFGEVHNGTMQLSYIGKYAELCITKIGEINKYAEVPLFVVMPNHIHMIIILEENNNNEIPLQTGVGLSYYGSQNIDEERLPQCDSPTTQNVTNTEMQRRANRCGRLSYIIGRFKSAVTRYAHENAIPFAWQTRYHDHIVRDSAEMNRIAEYIEQNPQKWETDCFYK